MATFTLNLSSKSINKAIKEIQKYQTSFENKCELLVKRLAEEGEVVAIQAVNSSKLGKTISLKSTTEKTVTGCKAILIATGQTQTDEKGRDFHTLLAVEFGAGIHYNKAETNPYASSLGFGVGTFPEQTHAFEDGWYYKDNDDKWHYTHGVQATMPMYKATMEIVKKYKQIASEVFG